MTIDITHGHHWPSTATLNIACTQAKEKDLEVSLDPYKVATCKEKNHAIRIRITNNTAE
jgi:hypothetical protein